MPKKAKQEISAKRILLTLAIGSGIVSFILLFMSMDRIPKSNESLVLEGISLWFGFGVVLFTVLYLLVAAFSRGK